MKLFNGRNGRALVAGLSLLAGASVVHADTETGLIKLANFATGLFPNDGFAVMMATPDPSGTGRCSGDQHLMAALLDGEASKALFSALLAAYSAGKSVTVTYLIDENGTCNLANAFLN